QRRRPPQAPAPRATGGPRHHQGQARLRPLGAGPLRRIRRPAQEAGAGEDHRGMSPEETIKALALQSGFDLCGIASLENPPPTLNLLNDWLAEGYAGEMAWMGKQREKRMDPT